MARTFGSLLLAGTIAFPAMASAQTALGPTASPLEGALKVAMSNAEQRANSAGYPRLDVLAAVSRSMWETFYHGDYTAAEEVAAVNRVSTDAETPIQKEAAARMKYELQLN